MISPPFRVRTTNLERAIARYSGAAERTLKEAFLRAMRGAAKRAMGITAPANADSARSRGGGLAHSDLARGQGAIARDLANVFVGVRLKGKRSEQLPNVAAKHRELFVQYKKAGKLLHSDLGRGRFYYVDKSKLASLRRDLRQNVGRLASGWLSAGQALQITGTPAWVARHGTSRGTHRLVLGLFRSRLTMANTNVPDELVSELDRRLTYALQYAANAMTRETEYILKKTAGDSGFKTR